MNRGNVVLVALAGDFGKPRPAVVIQSDLFNKVHASITVLPITSGIVDAPLFRVTLEPSNENGLLKVSQVMVDKIVSVKRAKVGKIIGSISNETMLHITRTLAVWVGVA